jgi:hypothetical protein
MVIGVNRFSLLSDDKVGAAFHTNDFSLTSKIIRKLVRIHLTLTFIWFMI